MILNIGANCEIRRASNSAVAGTSNVTGSGIDTQGYDGVCFILLVGALTSTQVTGLKAQYSSDDGSTDAYDDVAGSATGPFADADGNKMLVLDIHRPRKRYVKPIATRGTANAVVDGIIAILYRGEKTPVPTHSTCVAIKQLNQPAEGTA